MVFWVVMSLLLPMLYIMVPKDQIFFFEILRQTRYSLAYFEMNMTIPRPPV